MILKEFKICKKYVKLNKKLDTNKESEKTKKNLKKGKERN
jgi:hypothetical protein